jgi:hypothetical protein
MGNRRILFWLEPKGDRKWTGKDILWPQLDTPGLTKWARGPALIWAAFGAFLWTINALIGFFTIGGYRHWAVFYTAIWIMVTWCLLKMRREAAIGGFGLSVIALIMGIMASEYFLPVFMTWIFFNANLGTFAYQRFAKLETATASGGNRNN